MKKERITDLVMRSFQSDGCVRLWNLNLAHALLKLLDLLPYEVENLPVGGTSVIF